MVVIAGKDFGDAEVIHEMLLDAITSDSIECPKCHERIEPDGDCSCGCPNPLKAVGLI